MLFEQKDFVDVAKKSYEELDFIKVQFEKGKISQDIALSRAQFELFNLQRKMKVLSIYTPAEEIDKINSVISDYENFIKSIKPYENSL